MLCQGTIMGKAETDDFSYVAGLRCGSVVYFGTLESGEDGQITLLSITHMTGPSGSVVSMFNDDGFYAMRRVEVEVCDIIWMGEFDS
jgi:hypothetical protein